MSKQVQIEQFLKIYNIDILMCQEINILEDSFENYNFINSSYNIISNNASNKYGMWLTASSRTISSLILMEELWPST